MSGLVLRTTNQTFIDIARIAYYYGGNTSDQAAKKDQWMEFDDIYFFKPNSDQYFPMQTTPVNPTIYRTLPTINWPKE